MNSPYTIIPVIFSGTGEELDDSVNRYDIKTITSQKIGASNNYRQIHTQSKYDKARF
jgi:hypothetical protein